MNAAPPKPRLSLGPECTGTNTAAAQRRRILARLQAGPCDADTLAATCWAPCVTKRVSELRREGWPIRTSWTERRGPDQTTSLRAVYELPAEHDPRQLLLPLSDPTR
jgi:hypothetical protein